MTPPIIKGIRIVRSMEMVWEMLWKDEWSDATADGCRSCTKEKKISFVKARLKRNAPIRMILRICGGYYNPFIF